MHPGILRTWVWLFVGGAIGTALARHRDADRATPRTTGLVQKYFTYLVLTLGVLLTGHLPEPLFRALFSLAALGCLFELGWTTARVPESTGRRVFNLGALSLVVGLWGLWKVRGFDPSGNTWGYLWLVVGTTDAYAQVIGQGWGGPHLAPGWSPEKRWSGLIGGTAIALLVGFHVDFALELSTGDRLWVTLLVSLGASAGDLLESRMKRALQIKDFSKILGDHGGLYDRFDSLWVAAPVCALVLGRMAVLARP